MAPSQSNADERRGRGDKRASWLVLKPRLLLMRLLLRGPCPGMRCLALSRPRYARAAILRMRPARMLVKHTPSAADRLFSQVRNKLQLRDTIRQLAEAYQLP